MIEMWVSAVLTQEDGTNERERERVKEREYDPADVCSQGTREKKHNT